MEIDGLLLCSVCENQLQVEKYKGGNGFFIVTPCKHCGQPNNAIPAELLHCGTCGSTTLQGIYCDFCKKAIPQSA